MGSLETQTENGRILLVAAGDRVRRDLVELPELFSWRLLQASSGEQLLELLASESVDMALIDLETTGGPDSTTLDRLYRDYPRLPLIAIGDLPAGMPEHDRLICLSRPIDPGELHAALEQARGQLVYRDLVASEAQARRHLEDLLLIRQVAEAWQSSPDLDSYLDALVERIMTAVGVRHCSLMLCGEDGRLRIAAARGLSREVIASTLVSPGEGIAGHVLATGEPLLIPDLDADPHFDRSRGFDHDLSSSLLSVPLSCRGAALGVLNVNNKQDGTPFGNTDLYLLGGVAHQVALALENFRLVAELHGSRVAVERSNDRLEHQLRSRSRLVCNLSHELKTPLTSVLGYIDLALNHFDQLDAEELFAYLQRVHDEGMQMEHLINGMLTLFSLESGSGRWDWQPVDFAGLLDEALQARRGDIEQLGLQMDCGCPSEIPSLPGDPERLRYLLAALLDNAIKFNRPGGALEISLQDDGSGLELRIFNEGTPVPQDAAEVIFEQYTQLGDIESGKPRGVGIGLTICRSIVERLEGSIRLEPRGEQGTGVIVRLPRRRGEK